MIKLILDNVSDDELTKERLSEDGIVLDATFINDDERLETVEYPMITIFYDEDGLDIELSDGSEEVLEMSSKDMLDIVNQLINFGILS